MDLGARKVDPLHPRAPRFVLRGEPCLTPIHYAGPPSRRPPRGGSDSAAGTREEATAYRGGATREGEILRELRESDMTLAMSWEEWAQHDFTQLWARPPGPPNEQKSFGNQ